MEKRRKKGETFFLYGFFVIYAIVSLAGVITHESWADEAQAWLIARDLNVIEIVKQMKYEGHSCLWHLILMPFAKMRLSLRNNKIYFLVFLFGGGLLDFEKSTFSENHQSVIDLEPSDDLYMASYFKMLCHDSWLGGWHCLFV